MPVTPALRAGGRQTISSRSASLYSKFKASRDYMKPTINPRSHTPEKANIFSHFGGGGRSRDFMFLVPLS